MLLIKLLEQKKIEEGNTEFIIKNILFSIIKSENIVEDDIIFFENKLVKIFNCIDDNQFSTIKLNLANSYLPDLVIKMLDIGMIERVSTLIDKLKKINPKQETLFKINYTLFEKKIYTKLNAEIVFIIQKFAKLKEDDVNVGKYNLIAYLSFYFHEDNEIMKREAKRKLKIAINNLILEKKDFSDAVEYFVSNSKLDTANKIYLMGKELKKLKII